MGVGILLWIFRGWQFVLAWALWSGATVAAAAGTPPTRKREE